VAARAQLRSPAQRLDPSASVVEKFIRNYPDGAAEPALRLKPGAAMKSDWSFELGLRNAFEELVTIDREEGPVLGAYVTQEYEGSSAGASIHSLAWA